MVLRQVVVQPAAYLVEQAGVDIAPGLSGGIRNFQKGGEPNIDPKILRPPKWYLYSGKSSLGPQNPVLLGTRRVRH